MGAIFAVVFFLILLIVGLVLVVGGIIGVVVFSNLRKNGKNVRVFSIVFTVVMIVGILMLFVPVGFFSFIFMVNVLPPDDYVETDIVIEEDGYQDEMFTACGIRYVNTGLETYDVYDIMVPVFSYKTSGLLNGSQCGNYYLIENDRFYLITDGMGSLFCREEDIDKINEYYNDVSNICWYIEGEELISLSNDAAIIMESFYNNTIVLDSNVSYVSGVEYDVVGVSSDNVVLLDYYWFLFDGEFIYYCYEYDSSRELYTGYKLNSYENDILKESFGVK